MLSLYIGNKNYSSWSLRPWVLLRALNIDFTEQLVRFDDGGSWEKYRAFSPTGLVPCLHDGKIIVWESLAIIEHLADQHSQVWPADRAAKAWARSATAEMHAGFGAIRNDCPMSVGVRIQLADQSPALLRDLARLNELWQDGIDRFGGPYLAGNQFTAVDAFFAPVVFRIHTYGLEMQGSCAGYARHMLAEPAMRSWQQDALAEDFRESAHEVEIAALGEILADERAAATQD